MELTENLGLKKPAQTDFYNVDDFNENMDIIDEQIFSRDGSVPMNGVLWTGNGTNNGHGFINSNDKTTQIGICNVTGDSNKNRNINIHHSGYASNIADALKLVDKNGSETKIYNIFGEHNKNSMPFIPLTGGTLNGILTLQQVDNGSGRIFKNHNTNSDYGTIMVDRDADGNEVKLSIIANSGKITFNIDNVPYNIFGEHNVELVKQKVFAEVPASLV